MRSPLERVDERVIAGLVADRWRLDLRELRYLPVGGGAYHWAATSSDDRRWFVTCDDLDTKPWLGAARDEVFAGLVASYATASALHAGGLSFVAAPILSRSGAPAERVDERHSVSVSDHVDGRPGQWGHPIALGLRRELVTMLARLHSAPPPKGRLARRSLEVPERAAFERVLDDLGRPWDGGPFSEPTRTELAGHLDWITGSLADLDGFAGRVGETAAVVTHGEPHPGNLVHTDTGTVLVDWDTVALAPPERDLWMIDDAAGTVRSAYRDLTGVVLDHEGLAAYRLLWALADVVSFALQLRDEHAGGADDARALEGLRSILVGREPAPYG